MTIHLRISLFTLLALICFACKDEDTASGIPACIEDIISSYPPICGDSINTSVDEYNFQNETVYVFELKDCCCDYQSPVLNTSCDTIGMLYGITGNTTINGENFSTADFIRKIWP